MKKYNKIIILSIIMLVFNMLATLPIKAWDNKVTINVSANLVDEKISLYKLKNEDNFDAKKLLDELKNYTDAELVQKIATPLKEEAPASKIVFTNLEKGVYFVKQKDSEKNGKRLVPLVFELTSISEELTIEGKIIDNEKPKSDFKFIKIGKDTRERLKGAVFEVLVKKDGNFAVVEKELTSNENGEFELHNVPLGEYYLRELSAPSGYKKLDYNISFNIVEDSEKNYLEVENEKIPSEPTPNTPDIPNTGDVELIYVSILGASIFILGFIIVKKGNKR